MKKLFFYLCLITSVGLYSQITCNDLFEDQIESEICDDYEVVTATVYNAVESQCNEDPSHTAFMFKLDLTDPYKHRIVALSRDLLQKYPEGTLIQIKGTEYDGVYTVLDKMNKRYNKRIDILINEDMDIGKWDDVVIRKLNT